MWQKELHRNDLLVDSRGCELQGFRLPGVLASARPGELTQLELLASACTHFIYPTGGQENGAADFVRYRQRHAALWALEPHHLQSSHLGKG